MCARVRVAAVVSTQTVAPVLAFCVGCGVGSFDPRGAEHLKPSQTLTCVLVSCATVLLSFRATDGRGPRGRDFFKSRDPRGAWRDGRGPSRAAPRACIVWPSPGGVITGGPTCAPAGPRGRAGAKAARSRHDTLAAGRYTRQYGAHPPRRRASAKTAPRRRAGRRQGALAPRRRRACPGKARSRQGGAAAKTTRSRRDGAPAAGTARNRRNGPQPPRRRAAAGTARSRAGAATRARSHRSA
eukprot:scaffold22206_cov75-Phaeocystis_antarctica.AAC.1